MTTNVDFSQFSYHTHVVSATKRSPRAAEERPEAAMAKNGDLFDRSAGKCNSKVYATSGGLHGVGVSVVNALSDELVVEVARDRQAFTQSFSRGKPVTKLKSAGPAPNRRGTTVTFHPDPQIFAKLAFVPERLYRMARSKAYLFRGAEIRWKSDNSLLPNAPAIPAEESFHFPCGLNGYPTSPL